MLQSPYTLNGTNCYLVGTGPRRILIDTGEGDDKADAFVENLENCMRMNGVTGLQMILITHMHGDHFGGVEALQKKFGKVPVGMIPVPEYQLSLFTVRQLSERGLIPVMEAGPNPFKPDGTFDNSAFDDEMLSAWPDEDLSWDIAGRTKGEIQRDYWYMKRHAAFYERWFANDIPSVRLSDGDVIETEGATLRVMYTPGHAENHATFILDEERALFSGDTVLGYGTTVLQDLLEYMGSLHTMLDYKPQRLYPGHGSHIADGVDLLTRYIAHRQAREDQIVSFLTQAKEYSYPSHGVTAGTIVGDLYTDTKASRLRMANDNVEKVLLKLWRERRVVCYTKVPSDSSAVQQQRAPFDLPVNGYLRRLDSSLTWRLLAEDELRESPATGAPTASRGARL
jgi:glyoxylase-like metal-dependent hydrolase (beta-lactamase superfamily II)